MDTSDKKHGPITEPLVDERNPMDDLEGPTTVPTQQFEDSRSIRDAQRDLQRDSRLRNEREGVATLSPPSTSMLMARDEQQMAFSGTGSEYFRIWIVNITLTILTLGVYSAWAKVRRLQYFYHATSLEGICFDYVARPKNILGGRVIALALFGLYYLAHNFMPELGAVVAVAVIAGLPFLLLQSARFKARNTRHRSIAFHFDGTVADAYRTYLPPLVVAFGPAVLTGLVLSEKGSLLILVLVLVGSLALPFFHAMFRRFMQRNLRYGDAAFGFDATNRDFFAVWLKGMGLSVIAAFAFTLLLFVLGFFFAALSGSSKPSALSGVAAFVVTMLLFYLAYSCVGSYYTARFQKLTWEHTALGDISFKCNLSATRLLKRQFLNTILVIVTLGLYRPFAAINVAKLRVESMTVVGTERLDEFFAAPDKATGGAIGEGSAELFDMDVSF